MKYKFLQITVLCLSFCLVGCSGKLVRKIQEGEIMPYRQLWMPLGGSLDKQYTCFVFKSDAGYEMGIESIDGFNQKYEEGYIYRIVLESITHSDESGYMDATPVTTSRLLRIVDKKVASDYELREFIVDSVRYEIGDGKPAYKIIEKETGQESLVYTNNIKGFEHYFRTGTRYVLQVSCHPPLPEMLPDIIYDEYEISALRIIDIIY